jgi:hypothetical protein
MAFAPFTPTSQAKKWLVGKPVRAASGPERAPERNRHHEVRAPPTVVDNCQSPVRLAGVPDRTGKMRTSTVTRRLLVGARPPGGRCSDGGGSRHRRGGGPAPLWHHLPVQRRRLFTGYSLGPVASVRRGEAIGGSRFAKYLPQRAFDLATASGACASVEKAPAALVMTATQRSGARGNTSTDNGSCTTTTVTELVPGCSRQRGSGSRPWPERDVDARRLVDERTPGFGLALRERWQATFCSRSATCPGGSHCVVNRPLIAAGGMSSTCLCPRGELNH